MSNPAARANWKGYLRLSVCMVLWGSVASLAASAAALAMLGSAQVLTELSALAFAISLFAGICAAEARN